MRFFKETNLSGYNSICRIPSSEARSNPVENISWIASFLAMTGAFYIFLIFVL